MTKTELKKFIQARFDDPIFDGCYFIRLGKGLCLVFAKNANGDLDCKVAYNCDDLQCDYDCDFEIPVNNNGDLIGYEWTDVLECGYTADELADEVLENYKYVISCGWKKLKTIYK